MVVPHATHVVTSAPATITPMLTTHQKRKKDKRKQHKANHSLPNIGQNWSGSFSPANSSGSQPLTLDMTLAAGSVNGTVSSSSLGSIIFMGTPSYGSDGVSFSIQDSTASQALAGGTPVTGLLIIYGFINKTTQIMTGTVSFLPPGGAMWIDGSIVAVA